MEFFFYFVREEERKMGHRLVKNWGNKEKTAVWQNSGVCRDDGERCKARDLILNRVGATVWVC